MISMSWTEGEYVLVERKTLEDLLLRAGYGSVPFRTVDKLRGGCDDPAMPSASTTAKVVPPTRPLPSAMATYREHPGRRNADDGQTKGRP